jgi:hypothetical protein
MVGWRNRGISIGLAVCYGLAITVSGLLHDHGDGDACCHAVSGSAAHDHVHGNPAHDSDSHAPKPPRQCPSDGHCVVCQFLAQKTLPVARVEEVTSVRLVQEVAVPSPVRLLAPIAPSWHSRAPPDAA